VNINLRWADGFKKFRLASDGFPELAQRGEELQHRQPIETAFSGSPKHMPNQNR
jgi:hypothetical protein